MLCAHFLQCFVKDDVQEIRAGSDLLHNILHTARTQGVLLNREGDVWIFYNCEQLVKCAKYCTRAQYTNFDYNVFSVE